MKNCNHNNEILGLIQNACVCEIDIVHYTNWCLNNAPDVIFNTMSRYNAFVLDVISTFRCLHKIELVGDSILILGYDEEDLQKVCSSMISVCEQFLKNIALLRDIFQSNEIDVRIGVHIGDVYSGYIKNPYRLQVFGKTVNIACRLEALAIPSTIHISEEVLDIIKSNNLLLSTFSVGKTNLKNLKGIGDMNTVTLFAKRESGMIADDCRLQLFILGHFIYKEYNKTFIKVTSLQECFEILKKQYFEDVVVLDRFFQDEDSYPLLLSFRKWEQEHREERQIFIIISADESVNSLHEEQKVYKDCDFIDNFKNTFKQYHNKSI